MIAACPKCGARYRVERERIGPAGARLRCTKCQAVFRVHAPEDEAGSAAARRLDTPASRPSREAALPSPDASAFQLPSEPVPPLSPELHLDRDRMVLVADSDVETAKHTAAVLVSWGLQPVLVHDGVEALLTIQRMLPRVVVLDAGLPRMYGFQICEILKRNESLRHIKVVLVGTIYHKGRYHRPPSELYGADVYLEEPDLPDALLPFMTQFGLKLKQTPSPPGESMGVGPSPAPPGPPATAPGAADPAAVPPELSAPTTPRLYPSPPGLSDPAPVESSTIASSQPPAPTAVAATVAPAPTTPAAAAEPAVVARDELAEERAKAERLARIIVSDIILYQPDRFREAVLAGNVVEAMDANLDEGRTLFAQRIDARVREEKDFLVEELLRVARERGMR